MGQSSRSPEASAGSDIQFVCQVDPPSELRQTRTLDVWLLSTTEWKTVVSPTQLDGVAHESLISCALDQPGEPS